MGIFDWTRRAWSRLKGGKDDDMKGILPGVLPDAPTDRYDLLEAFYENNDLYAKLASHRLGPGKAVRSLRNPAHAAVEFHAMHLMPEPVEKLPLEAKSTAVEKAARKVLRWGNWDQKKQDAVRQQATHGDLYLKAENVEGAQRVYPKVLDPRHVSEFEKDERGFCVRVRLDIPFRDGKRERTRTEVWDKEGNYYALYEHDKGPGAKEEDLGVPKKQRELTDFGINFVPFVHAPFQGSGKERGTGCFSHALEPINEINKMASRANDLLFKWGKPTIAIKRNEAGQGAVSFEDLRPEEQAKEPEEVEVGEGDAKEVMLRFPGLAGPEFLVPPIPYGEARELMDDLLDTLSTYYLPELLYYVARDKGDPSGRALRLILAPTQTKAEEARRNLEAAVIQVIQMCLTLARNKGTFGEEVGSFEDGDFEMTIAEREILPVSDLERAEVEKTKAEADEAKARVYGLPQSFLRKEAGFGDVSPAGAEDVVAADPDVPAGDDLADTERIFKQLFPGGGA